jgi:hypothetical protein
MVSSLYDPLGFLSKKSPEALARVRDVTINNSCLAMIFIAGMYAAAAIQGSVRFQPDC